MRKCLLHASSTHGTIQNKLLFNWCLLNVNNIWDLLRYIWRTTIWIIHGIPPLTLSSVFWQNLNSKFTPHLFEKRNWGVGSVGWGLFPWCFKCHITGQSVLKTLPIKRKKIHETPEIKISIDSNLNFKIQAIQAFAWDLANDCDIHKNIWEITKHIYLFNFI